MIFSALLRSGDTAQKLDAATWPGRAMSRGGRLEKASMRMPNYSGISS